MHKEATTAALYAEEAGEKKQSRVFLEQLLAAAVKYGMADVAEFCAAQLAQTLSQDDARDTLALAEKLGVQSLAVGNSFLSLS